MDFTTLALAIAYAARRSKAKPITGSTPAIEGAGAYVCGTVTSISITPAQNGITDVIFTSGTTPAVLTVPNNVVFPAWFDKSNLEANTTYEININGVYAAVAKWVVA
jgi:hypothetical protein